MNPYDLVPHDDLIESKIKDELSRRMLNNPLPDYLKDNNYVETFYNMNQPETMFYLLERIRRDLYEYYKRNPNELHKIAGHYEKGSGV